MFLAIALVACEGTLPGGSSSPDAAMPAGGACAPVSAVPIGDHEKLGRVAADDRFLYWSYDGKLMAASRCDGIPTTRAAGPIRDFRLDGERVLFLQGSPDDWWVMSIPRDGGEITRVSQPKLPSLPEGIRYRSSYYWMDPQGVWVAAALDGLATFLGPPHYQDGGRLVGMAFDSEFVYWYDTGTEFTSGGVFRMSRRGGPADRLIQGGGYVGGPAGIGGLFSNADNLYFVAWFDDIVMLPKAGGPGRTIAGHPNPFDAAESNRYVYWTGWGGPGIDGLHRVDKSGATAPERVRRAGLADDAYRPVGNGDEVWVLSGDQLVRIPDTD